MSLCEALYWTHSLSRPRRSMELDSTDANLLAQATRVLLSEYTKLTGAKIPTLTSIENARKRDVKM